MGDLIKIQQAVESASTIEKFVAVYQAVHGCPADVAKQKAQAECFQFMRILHETPSLAAADYTELSARGVLLDVVTAGLSFDPMARHVYVMSRKVKAGRKTPDGKDIYEKRLSFSPQAMGLAHLARQAGSVRDVSEPVIVYEGDTFRFGSDNGRDWVIYEMNPAATNVIIGAFCYITDAGGDMRPVVITMREIERLKAYSAKNNGYYDPAQRKFVVGNPNELYSSNNGQIDPGFLATKLLKKALKNKDKKPIIGDTYFDDDTPGSDIAAPAAAGTAPANSTAPATSAASNATSATPNATSAEEEPF